MLAFLKRQADKSTITRAFDEETSFCSLLHIQVYLHFVLSKQKAFQTPNI
jgi:hypothetical protein